MWSPEHSLNAQILSGILSLHSFPYLQQYEVVYDGDSVVYHHLVRDGVARGTYWFLYPAHVHYAPVFLIHISFPLHSQIPQW